jgi:hypothetical protein
MDSSIYSYILTCIFEEAPGPGMWYKFLAIKNESLREEYMPEKCDFLERCGFFVNYVGNTEVITNKWIELFCEDKAKSEYCKRKKYRKETGQAPPDNMSPTGKLLR